MRNTVALFFFVSLALIYGCGTIPTKKETKTYIDNDSVSQSFDASPFCNALQNALDDFILKRQDDYARVINIWIAEQDSGCFVNIVYDICYDEYALCGYYIIDSTMIAYNYIKRDDNVSFAELYQLLDSVNSRLLFKESDCNCGLVDTTLLIRKTPMDYPSYKQICTTYDGSGRMYKIHSPDSLELVFEGYY